MSITLIPRSDTRHTCPLCGGETDLLDILNPGNGFCHKCDWFQHSRNEEHNNMLLKLKQAYDIFGDLKNKIKKNQEQTLH
jgi:hypothetical protein